MDSQVVLGALVASAGAFSYGFAAHDQLAARRFRELNPSTVVSDLDKSRNRRWHTAGAGLRLGVSVVLGAGAGAAMSSWVAAVLGTVVAGFLLLLLFDILFNLKFGMVWWYAGTTAWLDNLLTQLRASHNLPTEKIASGLELCGVLLSIGAWILFL
ncbi:hypothetical protein [Hymenobacter rubripertinctus]|uniref:Uncharacterized protein n=1 Tax=Hymenobacter rubripertinctus TaxID=2029981 RepID=A0A418QMP6_9BACT|nr:hypothetical protein [Hymenobacter rubripertinctus]RIY06483.1 hypothetical protein D0T11_18760 [Hymenobacter rubripertinctus]